MAVSIKEVNVVNLGPLGNRSITFSKLNLIYGKNETGKTYLTEFLLNSIFKHPVNSKWPVRTLPGQGKVVLSGVEKGSDTTFTPGSRKKIEDYWDQTDSGLPTNLARLLIVKGGELQIVHSSKESNKSILTTLLSQNALFENILNGIKPTIKKAKVKENGITGDDRGDINKRNNLLRERKNISSLIKEIERNYSLGPLREKEAEKDTLIKKIEIQQDAKRYHAYELNKKIESLEEKTVSEKTLEALHDSIRDYHDAESELNGLHSDLESKGIVVDDFKWLESAVRTWMELGLDAIQRPGKLILASIIAFQVLSLLLTAAQLVIGGQFDNWAFAFEIVSLGTVFISSCLIWIYIKKLFFWAKTISQVDEREAIKEGYLTRFGKSIRGLTDLRNHLEKIRNDYVTVSNLPTRIKEIEKEQNRFLGVIEEIFFEILGKKVECDEWDKTYYEIKDQQKKIELEIRELEKALAGLVLDEAEYRTEPADEVYDRGELIKLTDRKSEIEHEINVIENSLNSLKDRARQETGDSIGEDWATILGNLYNFQEEVDNEYTTITAKIISEIGIAQIVEELQQQEEEKVRKGLQSKEVTEILSTVTNHYRTLDIDGDKLSVIGDYGDFDVESILSTGAREQVFLALRMGFASRIAGGDPLFMILDDAFQHSDWDRRDRLFDVVFDLVESGWQITYLTMDEHIRDKYQKIGKERLGDDFQFYSLMQE